MSPIDALINQLQQLAENQGLPAGFAQFLQYYYEDADIDDLNHYALPQLLAGALSHYHFAGEPRQRSRLGAVSVNDIEGPERAQAAPQPDGRDCVVRTDAAIHWQDHDAQPRAWSPLPSPIDSACLCDRPVRTSS